MHYIFWLFSGFFLNSSFRSFIDGLGLDSGVLILFEIQLTSWIYWFVSFWDSNGMNIRYFTIVLHISETFSKIILLSVVQVG